jgi:hypothetical protein
MIVKSFMRLTTVGRVAKLFTSSVTTQNDKLERLSLAKPFFILVYDWSLHK